MKEIIGQNKRNTQVSIAPIRIFLHKSGENKPGYLICSDPLGFSYRHGRPNNRETGVHLC